MSRTGSTLNLKGSSHWPQARNRFGASKGGARVRLDDSYGVVSEKLIEVIEILIRLRPHIGCV